ncbi:MAG: ribonuclease III [Candidatus Zambryskibacteria bacterium RIFCSPLOWO2_12_FULL_39_45]|uniref:Ribonuclease 3 n=2 Tax=Candidatus Zambryskiibacteriota TaxID=1817925 RepID=A0A1G2T8N6_9BACT|nr:MAG: Ribonuclease 3 [Parcubacteria group bacterium GW2011_GWA2_40_14]OHA93522.1 MAG: ribonuclease III [Candidatus Zambryskibacteria bacterium RIFCSPHIGHO2_02_38_10.5]OHA97104.1 MAG: ribonuclease III [Candidatus Zambryskibacteria bacterium RIFCSPHIGHO2_02_FULL_39_82]OHA97681.1 MAG: ribonuclease III [Candidatus Zambryskibacteria bacterium RIFCSPHIGHO2_12_FULL_38_37]OHB08572.1 MAG: ribonuclease III [Candidatus Zambryskibacteria bacterium RIFCSPLOWO2_02_39_10]OHB09997.1 MAG: ribonuclease III [C
MDFNEFEKNTGLNFSDKSLLQQAFVHRSYINENKVSGLNHNERLEFLGDAVLELVITDFLYKKYTDKAEGDLTAYRSSLVNADTCAGIANQLGMGDYLLLSKGESKDVGRARQYILANALEALIGAIYIDQGLDSSKDFIERNFTPLIEKIISAGSFIDAKSLFQEKAQEFDGITPSYKTMKETGPDHEKKFTVGVYVGRDLIATGEGESKQDAEQSAARSALSARGW